MSQATSDSIVFKRTALFMGALFAVTAFSQVKLQTWEQGKTLQLAKDSKRFDFTYHDVARRGAILASDDKPLALDEESYSLTIKFSKVPHSDAFFMELAEATGIPASEFSSLAAQGAKLKSWLEPVAGDRYRAIMELRKKWRADGLSLSPGGQRTYPLGDCASCFVGVIKKYKTGPVMTGLEKSMNDELSGTDGLRVGLTDRSGAFLPMRMDKASKPRKDGQDVVLTIDRDLQAVASEAIKTAVETNQADNGVALVMNPQTGDILAMANWPSFDPNASTSNQGQIGFNPAYMAQLEPGSMFKVLTLAKTMDEGKVTLHDTIDCTGEWHPTESTVIHCDSHHGNRAHGVVNTVDAIARSCNVSAAIWATRVGRTDFFEYIKDLGLLRPSNLQVPGQLKGRLNENEYAQKLQLATLGFGQSITCTPVGLLGAFGMIGNDGLRMEPRLIRRIGSKVMPIEPGKQIVKPETAHAVMDCMEAVIQTSEGSGKKMRIPGYQLAGKTGTAQKVGKNQKGYVSNFVGFVPAPHPKALILVMVNHPKGHLYYGADVAGPVFGQLAKAVIRHYNIPPNEAITSLPSKQYTAEVSPTHQKKAKDTADL